MLKNEEELVDLAETDWWQENRYRVLRGYRHKHNMSQQELSEKSGIARSVIAQYESGKRRITLRAAEKLGKALGEDPQKLVTK